MTWAACASRLAQVGLCATHVACNEGSEKHEVLMHYHCGTGSEGLVQSMHRAAQGATQQQN